MIRRHLMTSEHMVDDLERERCALAYKLASEYLEANYGAAPEFLPITRAAVVAHKPKSKRAVYANAAKSLMHRPITPRDAVIKMFVKNERMNAVEGVNAKPPRAIQARKPRYNLELQRYLYNVERWVFHRGHATRVTTKGLDAYDKASLLWGAWNEFDDPVAILADHSRFDSRQHTAWLTEEHKYYKKFYPGDQYLATLLSMQIQNYGHSSNGVGYTVKGTRASGDANTSLGNSLTNIAIICYWLRDIQRKRIIVDGDDSVIIVERSDLNKVNSDALSVMGFGTTWKTVDEFGHVDFCQCKPVKTINGWIMVRDPQRCIERSSVCINPTYTKDKNLVMRWMHSVGVCESSCNAGVPILSAYAKFLTRHHDEYININDDISRRVVKRSGLSDIVTDQARISFWRAFSISPKQQLGIEKYFDTAPVEYTGIKLVTNPALESRELQLC